MPSNPIVEQNGRKYRSKKQRPCDLCRSRKTHCRITGSEATCELCKKLSRQCTFVQKPLRRAQNSQANGDNTDRPSPQPIVMSVGDSQHDPGLQHLPMPSNNDSSASIEGSSFWLPQMDWSTMNLSSIGLAGSGSSLGIEQPMDYALPQDVDMLNAIPGRSSSVVTTRESPNNAQNASNGGISQSSETGSEAYAPSSVGSARASTDIRQDGIEDWPSEFSLDARREYSNQLIGLSCESDPYLLRNYYYNKHDTYPMFRLDFRKMKDDASVQPFLETSGYGNSPLPADSPPVQFVMTHEDIWKDSQKFVEAIQSGGSTEEGDFELLKKIVPADLGPRLIKLYIKFVHSRFPVLSLSDFSRMPFSECNVLYPIGIQSAVYALAAPFTCWDDELSVLKGYVQISTRDLWAIAHRSYQRASCLSHLSSLQLCLLLLQMPPPNYAVAEPLNTWALSCSALSMAESLGLNLDPSDWRLPRKEIRLRRRLWWYTYMQHVWQALVIARPLHLNDDSWDVSPLTVNDFEGDEIQSPDIKASVMRHTPLCLAEYELSVIAADVLKEFYTLKAVRSSSSLSELLNRAQPLRARIENWRQSLPLLWKLASDLDEREFEDGASLRLSHLTLEILIFRALLRPLFHQAVSASEVSQEPITKIFDNCLTCAKVGTEIVSALKAKHFAIFWHPYVRYQLCYVSSFILLNLTQSPTKEIAIQNRTLLNRWRETLRAQSQVWPLARLATIRLDAPFWKGLSLVIHGAGPESQAALLIKEQETST